MPDPQSIYFADSFRGHNTLSGNPCSTPTASSPFSQSVREGENRAGSCGNAAERGNLGGFFKQGGLHQSSIFSTQERWGEQACDQLERVEFTHYILALQNGGIAPTKTISPKERLHDQNRSQRCIFFSTHEQTASTFSNVHLGGKTVSVHLPSLWFGTSSSTVHKTVEASNVPLASPGFFYYDYLPRRHNCLEPNSGRYSKGQVSSVKTIAKVIGKLTSSMQAVFPAPLHYRHLQRLQIKGLLRGKSYEAMVSQSELSQ